MPYALSPDEDPATGLRRIASEQAARGVASLRAGLDADPDAIDPDAARERGDAWDEAVHDARKRCKKIRAVARLCRDALGDAYTPINTDFRDAARLLSDARDAWTLVETVDLLADRDDDELVPPERLADLRRALVERYRSVRADTASTGRMARACEALEAAATRIADWPLDPALSAHDLAPSVERVYRRGRDGWRDVASTVEDDPHATTDVWHDWRKRVKYLWYHVRLLEPSWPDLLGALGDDLDDLGDDLGEDHDLGVLVRVVRTEPVLDPAATEQVVGAAGAQRHALRRAAALAAPRIYVEKPRAFARRVTGYLEVARA